MYAKLAAEIQKPPSSHPNAVILSFAKNLRILPSFAYTLPNLVILNVVKDPWIGSPMRCHHSGCPTLCKGWGIAKRSLSSTQPQIRHHCYHFCPLLSASGTAISQPSPKGWVTTATNSEACRAGIKCSPYRCDRFYADSSSTVTCVDNAPNEIFPPAS